MAVLCDCYRFRVLHIGRPGKFCWNVDRKPLWARSCLLEARQQENATDLVLSAPQVSKAMKEMRQQKQNPYHWPFQELETSLFFLQFYRQVKSNKFSSHGIALVVYMPPKKTGPNRLSNGKFMAVLRDCSRFRVLHTGRPGKFCCNADGKPRWA